MSEDITGDVRTAYISSECLKPDKPTPYKTLAGAATLRFEAWLAEERRAAMEHGWLVGYQDGWGVVEDEPSATNPYRKDKP